MEKRGRIDFYYEQHQVTKKLVISKLVKIVLNGECKTMAELNNKLPYLSSFGELEKEYEINYVRNNIETNVIDLRRWVA